MKAQDLVDILEKENFQNLKWDLDNEGWGVAVYSRNDGEELVQVTVASEPSEN